MIIEMRAGYTHLHCKLQWIIEHVRRRVSISLVIKIQYRNLECVFFIDAETTEIILVFSLYLHYRLFRIRSEKIGDMNDDVYMPSTDSTSDDGHR